VAVIGDRVLHLEQELILAARILAGAGEKIYAIKAFRAATGSTLKESKDWVERHEHPKPQPVDDARLQRLEDRVSMLERARLV
jgi:ribosomal protein L7/L12